MEPYSYTVGWCTRKGRCCSPWMPLSAAIPAFQRAGDRLERQQTGVPWLLGQGPGCRQKAAASGSETPCCPMSACTSSPMF